MFFKGKSKKEEGKSKKEKGKSNNDIFDKGKKTLSESYP
jgi:hypothetical protein